MKLIQGHGINDMPYGWRSENEWNYRVYITWKNMLMRCYSEKYQEIYPTYIGCSVCERWLTLSNFVEDIKKLENYDKWLENKKRYELDKDIKSNGKNKCYCLENCIFVTQTENTKQANKTRDNTQFQGENAPFYGKKHSESTKQKMSKANSGENNPKAKRVAQCDKQGNIIKIWDYVKQASEELGINKGSISACCKFWKIGCNKEEWFKTHKNRPCKYAGGYIWKYAEEE